MGDGVTDWNQPKEVSDLLHAAFPAHLEGLLPPMEEIPEDYEHKEFWERTHLRVFAGINPETFIGFYPVDGVDPAMAWRHLDTINRSY